MAGYRPANILTQAKLFEGESATIQRETMYVLPKPQQLILRTNVDPSSPPATFGLQVRRMLP